MDENTNKIESIIFSEDLLHEENIVEEQTGITISFLEGYHMESSTIIKLIVEDENVKLLTLLWEDNKIMYSDAISLEELLGGNNWMSTNNFYYLYQYGKGPTEYHFVIKTDRFLIDNSNNCYEYLGKNITDEIIAAISGQQNEYTGKYIYTRMESSETIETFLDDNNLKNPPKTFSDFINSYITITLTGNGRIVIGTSEGLWNSILFWGDKYLFEWIENHSFVNEIGIETEFYVHSGDSPQRSFLLKYYFNNEMEIVVHLLMDNHAIYSGEYEKIIKEAKTNEYKFFYKKIEL
jgi:hypothetical protein